MSKQLKLKDLEEGIKLIGKQEQDFINAIIKKSLPKKKLDLLRRFTYGK